MGTAIYTGVTGLLAHQRRLDVVASNIANVNTTGYRGSRMLFRDLFSQTLEGARGPSGNYGGNNAAQIGLGVRLGTIDVDHGQGSLLTTGVASDLAIQGTGYFVLDDGTNIYFSRDGSFALNANGLLIDPATGMRVQGYLADNTGAIDVNTVIGDITVPVGGTAIVKETDNISLAGNLNSDAVNGDTVVRTFRVYDSLGTTRDVQVTFEKTGVNAEWDWTAFYDDGTLAPPQVGNGTFVFDANGALDPTDAASTGGISITNIDLGALDAYPVDPFTFDIDFSPITQLSGDSDVTMSNQDGFPRGVLESFNIGEDGIINGVFTNGLTRVLGQIGLANFANVAGLERQGNNMFSDTAASGTAQTGIPNSGGRGQVTGGVLEGSNVDLGREFSSMIVTQRGFQANARTISAADTLLQETVNLVR